MSLITDYIPIKKPRKSTRIAQKIINEEKNDLWKNGPLGAFELLPIEIIHLIFGYLTIEDISTLSITSKCTRDLILLNFVKSKYLFQKWFLDSLGSASMETDPACIAQFQKVGLLMKRSTCLFPTKDRLKVMQAFFSDIGVFDGVRANQAPIWKCYGEFMQTLIAGWDESECMKVFEATEQFFHINKSLNTVLKSCPGKNNALEVRIRTFYRNVFLDSHENRTDEKTFWLTKILKRFTMYQQSKLLYILYGSSVSQDSLDWSYMAFYRPVNLVEARLMFTELTKSIRLMHQFRQEWSADDVISVIEDLIGVPTEWVVENVATFLLFCGTEITTLIMANRALNRRMAEIAELTINFCYVSQKYQLYSIDSVIKIMDSIMVVTGNHRDKIKFLDLVALCFEERILDLCDDETVSDVQISMWVHAQTNFMCRVLRKAFT
ncbi:Uncharacterised protein g3996 [Pycnogonum litorale]